MTHTRTVMLLGNPMHIKECYMCKKHNFHQYIPHIQKSGLSTGFRDRFITPFTLTW